MNQVFYIALAILAGMIIGTIFFGGLWVTIKWGTKSKIPALWFLFSFLVRVGVTLLGFFYISGGHLERLLACAAGFIAARIAITRLTNVNNAKIIQAKKEVTHEN